mmetsp:Transcript_48682/g.77564  ORF Transcript_48682/g.77564 Transcript_48682/m.77564 type:complete len:213 (-) Transcript_48682:738-1376(-)
MAGLVPPQVKPAGKRTFAIWQTGVDEVVSSSFASLHNRSTVFRSRPATEHIACGTSSVAFCMASARNFTKVKPSSNSRTPAAHSAVYSPRLSPATAWTRSTVSRFVCFMSSTPAMPAINMMGWQYLVSLSRSSGPSKQSCFALQPRICSAFSNIFSTAGISKQLCSMPLYWEPCPGNIIATGRGGLLFAGGRGIVERGRSILAHSSSGDGSG